MPTRTYVLRDSRGCTAMSAHGLDLERPYRELGDPLEMDDAREAAHLTAKMRRRAEGELVTRIETRAEKEADYRATLAKEIVQQKVAHGSTVAKELAHQDSEVKKAFVEFKVAEGMVDAAKERLRGLEGERSMLKSLIDWSATIMNVLRQSGGHDSEPR
jgi:translation initiation factor 1 (eIF-1/SUI1)